VGGRAGGLFECMGELQHAQIIAEPAAQLQSDRQSPRKSRRHGDGRHEGRRKPVQGSHPCDVVRHGGIPDLRRPMHGGIEWQHLGDGGNHEGKALLKFGEAFHQSSVVNQGAGDLAAAEARAVFNFPDRFGFQLIAM